MNVYEKLMTVQSKLKAPKNQYNSFGKYNYRSCEDILEGLKPLLAEVKAIVNLTDEIEQIGDRFYIKATAIFIDVEKGEKIEVSASAREDENKKGMDLAQVTGSVSSYARKYALNGLFCIDDTKDSDSTNTHDKDKPKDIPKDTTAIEEKHLKAIYAVCKAKGVTEDQLNKSIHKEYKKASKKELSMKEFKHLMDRLNKMEDAKGA